MFPPLSGEADQILEAIANWTQSVTAQHGQQAGGIHPDPDELGRIVEELLQKEQSFAEQNAKRFKLVLQAMQQPHFGHVVHVLDLLMEPLDHAMNQLFKRTSILKQLRFREVKQGESLEGLKKQSQELFLHWTSGAFGKKVMHGFLCNLRSYELASFLQTSGDSATLTRVFFQLALFGISDIWRRFCLAVQGFPWAFFSLLDCSQQDFFVKWAEFSSCLATCPSCVDAGFGAPLLRMVDVALLDDEGRGCWYKEVLGLLGNLAIFSPMASDAVENLHGQNQFNLHSWRGAPKGSPAAAEISTLSAACIEHSYLKSLVLAETMPSKMNMAQMSRRLGLSVKQGRQQQQFDSVQKRLKVGAERRIRKLSPWNVFLRERLREESAATETGKLSKEQYAAATTRIGQEWEQTDKAEYRMQAAYEQACREELATRPLAAATKASAMEDPADIASAASSAALNGVAPDSQRAEVLQHVAGGIVASHGPCFLVYVYVLLFCLGY